MIRNFSKTRPTRITNLPKNQLIRKLEYSGTIFKDCEVFDINIQDRTTVTALWAHYRNDELYRDFICMERIGEDEVKYVTVIKL